MRQRYKAGLGLSAGLGLMLACAVASAEAPQQQQLGGAPVSYLLAPLTGQPGPGWSPHLDGAPMMMGAGRIMPCCAGLLSRGGASQDATPHGFGAGLGGGAGGPQQLNLGPLPGADFGEWAPRLGIGPRAFDSVVSGY